MYTSIYLYTCTVWHEWIAIFHQSKGRISGSPTMATITFHKPETKPESSGQFWGFHSHLFCCPPYPYHPYPSLPILTILTIPAIQAPKPLALCIPCRSYICFRNQWSSLRPRERGEHVATNGDPSSNRRSCLKSFVFVVVYLLSECFFDYICLEILLNIWPVCCSPCVTCFSFVYIYIHKNKHIYIYIYLYNIWVFPKIGIPQNGWSIMENPIKMDDLGGKPTIFGNTHIYIMLWPLVFWKPNSPQLSRDLTNRRHLLRAATGASVTQQRLELLTLPTLGMIRLDASEIREKLPFLIYVDMVYIPLFTKVLCIPGGAGFLPATVLLHLSERIFFWENVWLKIHDERKKSSQSPNTWKD